MAAPSAISGGSVSLQKNIAYYPAAKTDEITAKATDEVARGIIESYKITPGFFHMVDGKRIFTTVKPDGDSSEMIQYIFYTKKPSAVGK